MENMKNLEERIKYIIKDRGLSQQKLADGIGISASAVNQWCNGSVHSINIENAFAIAKLTGFSAEWIGTGKGPVRIQAHDSSLDSHLLSSIINAVLVHLEKLDIHLPGESIAGIIDILYTDLADSNQQDIDEGRLIKLISLSTLPFKK